MFDIKVTRSNTLESRLRDYLGRFATRVEVGVRATTEALHLESLVLVPKDTSALMESSHTRFEGSGFGIVGVVGYGIKGEVYTRWSEKEQKMVVRIPAEYARWVHDVPAAHDNGQMNFLGEPCNTKQPELRETFRTAFNTASI